MTRFFTPSNTRNIFESLLSPPHTLHNIHHACCLLCYLWLRSSSEIHSRILVRELVWHVQSKHDRQRMLSRRCKTTAELALPRSTLYRYRIKCNVWYGVSAWSHEARDEKCTSTVRKRIRSRDEMQSMHVIYTCKPEMHRHERNAHAEKQRREARNEQA